jgi:hypothetical protein
MILMLAGQVAALLVGFDTGNPQVGISHTAPVPLNTVTVAGTGTYRTVIYAVSYETRGVLFTHG